MLITHYQMKNKKDIGTIIREKINHLDKTPNDDGWNIIQAMLDQKKKRKKSFYWLFIIVLFFTGILSSWLIFCPSLQTNKLFNLQEKVIISEHYNTNISKIRNKETDTISSNLKKSLLLFGQNCNCFKEKCNENDILSYNLFFNNYFSNSDKNSSLNISKIMNITETSDKIKKVKLPQSNIVKTKYLNNSNKPKNKRSNHNKKNNFTVLKYYNPINDTSGIDSISTANSLNHTKNKFKAVIKAENTIPSNQEIESNKYSILQKKIGAIVSSNDSISKIKKEGKLFNIFIYGSPTYTLFFSKNSTLDMRLNTNSKKSKIIFNYGVYFSYQATENFSIRFGIGRNKSTITTKNALINTANYSNIEYKDGFSNTSIFNQSNNSEYMNITQEISYSEIPIEVKYNLINNKIGVNAIIGLNYLFLSNNEVSITADNGYFAKIGKTTKLLSKTFGMNLGLGIDYQLTPKIKINFEPMLKYQFNSKNNLESSNVINLIILTGLEFSIFDKK